MFRKKIAVLLTAVMTISSIGVTAFAASGDKIDQLHGSLVKNGLFEQNKDGWTAVTGTSIERVINDTYDGSAGSALIKQTAAAYVTHQTYNLASNVYYNASVYVRLKDGAEDTAQLVLTQGSKTITSESVDVSDEWTLVDVNFLSSADSSVVLYVKCATETEFYIDDVKIVKVPTSWTGAEVSLVDGEVIATMTADAEGNAKATQAINVLPAAKHEVGAWVKIERPDAAEDATTEATARMIYHPIPDNLNLKNQGDVYDLAEEGIELGEWFWVPFKSDESGVAVNNTANSSDKTLALSIAGAEEDDIITFKDFGVTVATKTANASIIPAVSNVDAVTSMLAGTDFTPDVTFSSGTDMVRYYYMVADSEDADAEDWTVIESYMTVSGTKTVNDIFINASYAGKYIKLRVDPMDKFGRVGNPYYTPAISILDKVDILSLDSDEGTTTLTLRHNTGEVDKAIAVIVAYYNSNDEIVAVGVDNNVLDDGEEVPYTINVDVESVDYDYTKIYICEGGADDTSTMVLAPLTDAK